MLTAPWPSHFTPSMIRTRQRGRQTLDLQEDSEREPILQEDQAALKEVKVGVEVDQEVDQEADQEVDQEEVQELAHPLEEGLEPEEVRQVIHQAREGPEEEIGVVPLEGKGAVTLKAIKVVLLEAAQDQEGVNLNMPLVRVDHPVEEAALVARDKEEVVEMHRHNPTVTEDRRDRAAVAEEDHKEDQEDLQEAEDRDRIRMELLAGPQGASVGITRQSALLDSGARATSGLTVCSPGTRARRSTGRRGWTTTPGSSGLGPVCRHTGGETRNVN